jgi:hypothetical protein
VQRHLAAKGLKLVTGTIVDATIINAPSSTKNADKARDPEMRTKKGNQWYFDGLRAHPLCAKSEHKILDIGREDTAHGASSSRKRIQRGRF